MPLGTPGSPFGGGRLLGKNPFNPTEGPNEPAPPPVPPAPGNPAAPAPTTPKPVSKAPQWKTDLWKQYVAAGKPGDWQAYWRARQPGATPPPTPSPGTPTPGPNPGAPLNPAIPPGVPATPGQMIPALNMPQPDYNMPWGPQNYGMFDQMGGISMPGDFNDPYNAYLASIPVMENMRDQQISDSMAKAGFSGNRYSTAAMNAAGQIGADTAMKQNQMLNQLMYDQSQQDLNRAMQSAGLGMQLGSMQDQMVQDRMNPLFQYGNWEQSRQDQFARMAYEDYERNKLGYLPYLLQAAGGVGSPNSGTPVQTVTDPGKPATIPPELLQLLIGLF